MTNHYVTFFTWLDFAAGIGGVGLVLYAVLSVLVPTDFMFLTTMLDRTQSAVQTNSFLMPKFHVMNDSVNDMIAVAKDIINHKQRAPPGNCCQKMWYMLCCNSKKLKFCLVTKWSKIRGYLDQNITKELDLVRLLRRNREYQGLIWALTTRN